MTRQLVTILLIACATFARGQHDALTDAQLKYVYKTIMKTDQSHVNDNEIRHLIFKTNFNQIISIIQNQGYPKYKEQPKKKKDQTIIKTATTITFFHILQSAPEMLLDPAIIALLKNEIDAGNMPKEVLFDTLKSWKRFNDNPNNNHVQQLSDEILTLYNQAIRILED